MGTQIHWFPGHMKKALNEIEEKIKIVDVVIEILDSRIPFSSINESLERIIANKKKLVIFSKPDLADIEMVNQAKEKLANKFDEILILDLTKPDAGKIIAKSVNKLGEQKHLKDKAKGMKPQPIRTMILGIPNVGKSSLINRFANRKAAGVSNRPGYTRGEQWIKVNNDFLLLDTPGVLPMNYEDKEKATKLALVGSIKEEILPNDVLVNFLLKYLRENYPSSLKERFDISNILDADTVLKEIALKRHLVNGKGEADILKAEATLLKEFKDGKLGRISLE